MDKLIFWWGIIVGCFMAYAGFGIAWQTGKRGINFDASLMLGVSIAVGLSGLGLISMLVSEARQQTAEQEDNK